MTTVVVGGAVANKAGVAGEAWVRMSWAVGLRRLGYDVLFLEEIASSQCVDATGPIAPLDRSVQRAWFDLVIAQFGFDHDAALVCDGRVVSGMSTEALHDRLADASVLLNLSGQVRTPALLERVRRRVFVDIDPGFTQLWHVGGQPAALEGHHEFFTIGENIGTAACSLPTAGVRWRPTRQPVVLDDWPWCTEEPERGFTTVATWRSPFGRLSHDGHEYGLKLHEFRRVVDLPTRCRPALELALAIDPADRSDLDALRQSGWLIVEATRVAGTPDRFRRYVQRSTAEFSCAQGVYVETASGWFSDRTARYLASGRPAVVQDTGFSRWLPTGEGVFAFLTVDDAARLIDDVASDYARHAKAARAVAEAYFDSDLVLGRLMEDVGVAP